MRIKNFLRGHWLFLTILLAGIFLRSYKAAAWFPYGHDNDLNGWIIRDILENRHLRLIGQETSSNGVFIGPLFYYLLIPLYVIFKMDPAGSLILPIIISGFSIFSFYWVFSKIFNRNVGLISCLIYSLSALIVFTDREVVPTMPVMLWSVWFLYGLWLLLKGKQESLILLGVLLGLAWNFNLALLILTPLVIMAIFLSKKAVNFKYLVLSLPAFVIALSPFLAFEVRHNFAQTKAIYASLTSNKDYVEATGKGYAKFDRTMQLVFRNTTRLFWGADRRIPGNATFLVLIFIFAYAFSKSLIPRNLSLVMFLWLTTYIIFFSFNAINVSEYYLNGMNVIWIGVLAVLLNRLFENNKFIGLVVLGLFVIANLQAFRNRPAVTNGYRERKELVEFIKEDASKHSYPCVSVSFITSPGGDFGYRYFFWLLGLHVNHPDSGSPVYTIAFPHTLVGRIDKSFGSLGLVLPGYERYTKKAVEKSCQGEDSNLTDPMIKFTR